MAAAPADARASASAASTASRTSFTTTPTRGRSSGGRLPMPRRSAESAPPLRPRYVDVELVERRDVGGGRDPRQRLVAQGAQLARSGWRDPRCRAVPPWSSRESRTLAAGAREGLAAVVDRPDASPARRQAPRATSTIRPNVASSRTARSARILRSSSISAFLRPAMNAPYGQAVRRAAALIRIDPQLAHLALALLAVAGRVGQRVEERLAGRLDQARLRVPFRPSAALRSRLWRLWAVTPRLTRAIGSAASRGTAAGADLRRRAPSR